MPELGDPLTDREIDVLECIVDGATNQEVANALTISQNTVKVHLRRIYTKLGVSSRTEATTVALQQGLVTLPGLEVEDEPEEATTAVSAPEADATETGETTEEAPPPLMDTAGETAVSSPRRWQIWALIVALVLSLGVIGVLGWQVWAEDEDNAPPETAVSATSAAASSLEPVADSRWQRITLPLPGGGLAHSAVAAVGLDLYSIGGETAGGVVDTVQVFDTRERTWREAAAKPTAVADASAAVLFGEIYVAGGRLGEGEAANAVEAYSPANNAWRALAALPQPAAGGLLLAERGFLYYFGGWDGEQYLDTAYEYDPRIDSWRPLPASGRPRAYAAGGSVAGALYVVGGYDGRSVLGTCQFYTPTNEKWASCPEMLQPRQGAGAAVLLNQLYVIGGTAGEEQVSFSEEYSPDTETWHVLNTPMLNEGDWAFPGVTSVETRIYALGGRRGEELLADAYTLPVVYQTFIPAAPAQ